MGSLTFCGDVSVEAASGRNPRKHLLSSGLKGAPDGAGLEALIEP